MNDRSARLTVVFSSIGHTFSHLLMLLYPTVVLGLEGRFGWTYGELLSLSTAGFILFGAGALPAGWLGDRWSAERMMVVYFLGTGGAAVVAGLADGPLALGIGLALIGLFGSIYHPVGIAWLVRNAENRGRVLGWNGIFGSLGVGFGPLVAGALTDLISWRAAFLVPGVLCAATGVVLAAYVRSGAIVATRVDRRPEPPADRAAIIRAFIVLSVTMLGAGLVGQVMTVAMPKLFQDRLHGLTDGGLLGPGGFVTLVFLGSAAAQIVGGWLADRYPLKLVYVLSWAAQIPLYIVIAQLVELPLLGAMMAVSVIGVFAVPAENSLLARYTPGKWRATAFGAKFVLALGVSALGVPLVGFVYDRTGSFYWLFVILGAVAAVIVAAGAFLPSDRGRPSAAAVPAE